MDPENGGDESVDVALKKSAEVEKQSESGQESVEEPKEE